MDADDLIRQLQVVLGLQIRTGEITLTLRDSVLETVGTRVYRRVRPKIVEATRKVLTDGEHVAHTAG